MPGIEIGCSSHNSPAPEPAGRQFARPKSLRPRGAYPHASCKIPGWLVFLALPGPLAAGSPGGLSSQTFDRILEFTRTGPSSVVTETTVWVDRARQRPVPLKLYYPAGGEQRLPVIVYSTGWAFARRMRVSRPILGQSRISVGASSTHAAMSKSGGARSGPERRSRLRFDDPQTWLTGWPTCGSGSTRWKATQRDRRRWGGRIDTAGSASRACLWRAGRAGDRRPVAPAVAVSLRARRAGQGGLALSSPVSGRLAGSRGRVCRHPRTGPAHDRHRRRQSVGPTSGRSPCPYDNIQRRRPDSGDGFRAPTTTFSGHLAPPCLPGRPLLSAADRGASTAIGRPI